ncbi:hypothetical protein E2542_SST18464 [Spatholobus suberectus]|nr:hypothetical protein E2542_SST18464 [Spatholobus suberectus]
MTKPSHDHHLLHRAQPLSTPTSSFNHHAGGSCSGWGRSRRGIALSRPKEAVTVCDVAAAAKAERNEGARKRTCAQVPRGPADAVIHQAAVEEWRQLDEVRWQTRRWGGDEKKASLNVGSTLESIELRPEARVSLVLKNKNVNNGGGNGKGDGSGDNSGDNDGGGVAMVVMTMAVVVVMIAIIVTTTVAMVVEVAMVMVATKIMVRMVATMAVVVVVVMMTIMTMVVTMEVR